MVLAYFGEPTGQGLTQVAELTIALVLSSVIGLERDIRQKSAGLRTHTLVGFGSALLMLVSKYGFTDVLGNNVELDPSRVAAQIVSGLGFIGGGIIFVRRDTVRGLTTAASIWLTAAVGMAAGAGLWLLAVLSTIGYFLVVFVLSPLADRLPGSKYGPSRLRMSYLDGRGVLRRALVECADHDFVVGNVAIDQPDADRADRVVSVRLSVQGRGSLSALTASLAEIDGVLTVSGNTGELDTI